jgi:hypothetical protein
MIRRTAVVLGLVIVLGFTVFFVVGLFGSSTSTSAKHKALPSTTVVHATTTKATNPVTMSFVGDTDLGSTPNLAPNASTYFANVQSALNAPIEFMNLEGTLTDGTDSKCGASSTNCYAFRNPPSFAQIFKAAGFNVVNSANNHSHDFGSQGVADTTAAIQGAGISQAGLPQQIGLATDGQTKVAFVDFAPYSNTNNLLDLPAAKTLIAQAKAEAQVVVVYMHAGAEGTTADHVTGQEESYVGEDRGNAEAFAHAAIDDGADLVVASGPHVLRGMQWYSGHLIAYSLGNFAGYQNFAVVGDLALSGILQVTLDSNGSFASGHFSSTLLNSLGQPSLDTGGQAASFVNQLSQQDFGPTAALIQPDGNLAAPPAAP